MRSKYEISAIGYGTERLITQSPRCFLVGNDLSGAIRRVMGGRNLRCAVAFWGVGAADFIRAAGSEIADARILCDISMGGCWPGALEELGAPDNERLRRQDGLHAKVYISDIGMVVGSPNASANGIGFNDRKPIWLEAGTFHEPSSRIWKEAVAWFDQLYDDAQDVDDAALAEARRRWQPPFGYDGSPPRPGSLLDLVRTDPDLFGQIGFVFVGITATKEERNRARQALKKQAGVRAEQVDALPDNGLFTKWTRAELKRWPATFVEFWITQRKLRVYGRQVRFFEKKTGSVFTETNWAAIRSQLPKNALTAASIAQADAKTAAMLLAESGEGILYSSPRDLSKALIQRQFRKPSNRDA